MNYMHPLPHSDLLQLKRWNTPTIYNGWEQITRHNAARDALARIRADLTQLGASQLSTEALARETLPKLEQHLQKAEQINAKLPDD